MDTPETHEHLTIGELRLALARGLPGQTVREALNAIEQQDEASRQHEIATARHGLGESTGPAGIGAVLHSEAGEVIGEPIAKSIGLATNNFAEYTALIEGLQMALAEGVTELDVRFDSPAIDGHLVKGHKIKSELLRPLIERVRELLDSFSTWTLTRVPRAENADADKLANQGIDDAMST